MSFTAIVGPETALGPTRLRMVFTVLERVEGEDVTLRAEGTGAEQAVDVRARFRFRDVDEGSTAIDWTADIAFFGPIRAVGQRVLPALAQREIDRILLRAAQEAVLP